MANLLGQIGRGGPAFFQAFSSTTDILSRPGEQKRLKEVYLQEKEKRQLEIDSLKIQAAKEAKQVEIDKKLDTPVNIENIGSILTKIQPFLVESPYAAKAFKDYLKDMGLSDENGNIIPRDVVNALGDINKDTTTAQEIFFKPEYDMRNGFYNQKLNEYNKYLQEGGDPNDSKGQKLRVAVDILDKRRNDVLERQRDHAVAYNKLKEAQDAQAAATQHEKEVAKYNNELPLTAAQNLAATQEKYTPQQLVDDTHTHYSTLMRAYLDENGWIKEGQEENYRNLTTQMNNDLQLIGQGRRPTWLTGEGLSNQIQTTTPKKYLSPEKAKEFLDKAGGDRAKAEQMARDEGYTF